MSKSALIFAAGLGTRLKPLTDTIPKALVSFRGVPLLEQVMLKLKSSGFTRVVINVHHFADMIEEFVSNHDGFGMEVLFSDERDLLRDTGGGIRHAESLLEKGDDFLVHNVDIISNLDIEWLYQSHISRKPLATLVVSDRDTARYLLFDEDCRLVGWTNISTGEVKSPFPEIARGESSDLVKKYRKLAFGGIHIISPDIFPLMADWPEKFSIIDFYLSVADRYAIYGCESPQGTEIFDVGKLNQLV